MTTVREAQAEFATRLVTDVAALARAGLLHKRMDAGEFRGLMDLGLLGEGSRDHVELLDGEIVIKAMGKGSKHELYKAELVDWFVRHRPSDLSVGIEPTIDFSRKDVFEPDIVLYPRRHPTKTLTGPQCPLVIEVADSSLPFDTREKARAYARLGVPAYWVVDVLRGHVYVHTRPGPDGYAERPTHEADQPIDTGLPGAPPFRLVDLDLPPAPVF